MGKQRHIRPEEADLWMATLLDTAFDPATGIAVLEQRACSQLLALASDFVNYPHDHSPERRAELLVRWGKEYVGTNEWTRLQSRIRRRRARR